MTIGDAAERLDLVLQAALGGKEIALSAKEAR